MEMICISTNLKRALKENNVPDSKAKKTPRNIHRRHDNSVTASTEKARGGKPESAESQERISEIDLQRIVSGVAESLQREWGKLLPFENSKAEDQAIPGTEEDEMAKRQRACVVIDDQPVWLSGESQQDLFDAYVGRLIRSGKLAMPGAVSVPEKKETPMFGEYCLNFNRQYKSGQESNTIKMREYLTRKHLIPRFGMTPVGDITTGDLQQWFDGLCKQGYSREALLKIKNIMSPVLDSAVEDGIIPKNPFKSKRFKINTDKGGHHKAIPIELFKRIREGLHELPDNERRMMAILTYTGLRLEEVLGLRWEDIDIEHMRLSVRRAVVHADRNKPEIKAPKTVSSRRTIPITEEFVEEMKPLGTTGFVLGGEEPLTYTVQKKMFIRIRKKMGFEGYSAHDFRATCATVWRENGMQLDLVKNMLGHGDTAVTERCYVNYRDQSMDEARDVLNSLFAKNLASKEG